ncbi:MAG: hypothetical protein QMC51_04275 [Alteromonadaceae bacterium]
MGTAQTILVGDIANKKPATLFVNLANREIRSGNFVLPIHQGQLLPSYFTMRPADNKFRGAIFNPIHKVVSSVSWKLL